MTTKFTSLLKWFLWCDNKHYDTQHFSGVFPISVLWNNISMASYKYLALCFDEPFDIVTFISICSYMICSFIKKKIYRCYTEASQIALKITKHKLPFLFQKLSITIRCISSCLLHCQYTLPMPCCVLIDNTFAIRLTVAFELLGM